MSTFNADFDGDEMNLHVPTSPKPLYIPATLAKSLDLKNEDILILNTQQPKISDEFTLMYNWLVAHENDDCFTLEDDMDVDEAVKKIVLTIVEDKNNLAQKIYDIENFDHWTNKNMCIFKSLIERNYFGEKNPI